MNHQKVYDNIIEKARTLNRVRQQKIYYEKHHINPKCLNGTDEKVNLVLLTAREHFICHMLLCKIYPTNTKLLYALWRLINSKGKQGYKITSRTYEIIKRDLSLERSKSLKGKQKSKEHKDKIRNAHYGIRPSIESLKNNSESNKNSQKYICEHCGILVHGGNYHRWHGNKCKKLK